LLPRHSSTSTGIVSLAVAPGNPNLGVMLPYTPLHHLLLSLLGFPIVATSGNLTDEPICIDEHEALQRLNGVADLFLVHNRPIVRHVDDSIVRVVAGREMVLRRARGYAPLPIELQIKECNPAPSKAAQASADPEAKTMLAVGAHLKNTVGLGLGRNVFISQHIGDLETVKAYDAFERVAGDLQQLFDAPAALLVADSHPDYLSTKFARSAGVPFMAVQHHVAHVLSCMAENHVQPPVLGVAWDGTGYGLDGTVWGGEFFHIHEKGFERVAHFRQFRLPGGEQAVREARRSAAGMLFDTLGAAAFEQSEQPSIGAFSAAELSALSTMLARGINSPLTSSAGRIFDAVASLTGLRQTSRFEGQAAMELEFILEPKPNEDAYELLIVDEADPAIVDWRPMIKELLADHQAGVSRAKMSLKFHNGLVESILNIAKGAGLERVVLSGGCFQNRYLTEASVRRLTKAGFRPYWHQRVPPNDGGICLGQVVAARWWSV
ncbi:MAG TPA: Sua5/YciO/YrdC/YwlC family protein, partial [Patescibacteria group bacterium]|nr:Sua5/YciO/YrdC/YwlC family protein [Patescibacteria group bacterium]